MKIKLKKQNLILNADKTLFWEDKKILMLSDLHLGKTGHFKKSGIAAPEVVESDLCKLQNAINKFNPRKVIITGDLFHAEYNGEWDIFKNFKKQNSKIKFDLVIGNHDRVNIDRIYSLGLDKVEDILHYEPFSFIHRPEDVLKFPESNSYFITGHIHPGVQLTGLGKQELNLQCFYFSKTLGILPSFGAFTGRYKLRPVEGDKVYLIAENSVIKALLE